MRIGATEGSASGPAPSVRHQGGHSPKVQCEADQRPFSPHLLLAPHLASLGERTVLAAATHIHFGHTGAHPEFAGRAARPSEARYLAESDFEAVLIEPFATTWTFSTWPPGGFDPQSSVIMSAPTARLIEDGSVLGLGVGQLEAIHPPGHSPGSIVLWKAASAVLFSCGAFCDWPGVTDDWHPPLDGWMRSMERLLALPFRTVHGGHFPGFAHARFRD